MSSFDVPHASKPLNGKAILITRSAEQSSELSSRLEHLGAIVTPVPLTVIGPPSDWASVDDAIKRINAFDWIVFASPNAVKFFFNRCTEIDSNALKATSKTSAKAEQFPRLAVVGAGTAAKLEAQGVQASFVPSVYFADAFVREFTEKHKPENGENVLWVRGNLGRTVILDELTKQGFKVETVEAYRNTCPDDQAQIVGTLDTLWLARKPEAIIFASSQSAKEFARLFQKTKLASGHSLINSALLASVRVISIGPETSKTCREYIGKVDAEAVEHSINGLVATILDCFKMA